MGQAAQGGLGRTEGGEVRPRLDRSGGVDEQQAALAGVEPVRQHGPATPLTAPRTVTRQTATKSSAGAVDGAERSMSVFVEGGAEGVDEGDGADRGFRTAVLRVLTRALSVRPTVYSET